MTAAYCCEKCGSQEPRWVIMRQGDAVITWACDADLAAACDGLQRDGEVTGLIVICSPKAREWAEISKMLGVAAEEFARSQR